MAFRDITSSVAPWTCSHTTILAARTSMVALKGVITSTRDVQNRGLNLSKRGSGGNNSSSITGRKWSRRGTSRIRRDITRSNALISTTGEESTGEALFFSDSSFKYSASIFWISVENVGITSISFFSSLRTQDFLHNSMINTRKMSEFSLVPAMMQTRQAVLAWRRMDLFWEGMIMLLMKPKQYLTATLRSFFSIGTPTSIHLGVSSDIRGANYFFITFQDCIYNVTITFQLSTPDDHIVNMLEFGCRLLTLWHQGTIEFSNPIWNVRATELSEELEFVGLQTTYDLWVPINDTISRQPLLLYDGPQPLNL
ncbi:hypothetical protein H5410_050670 [Solanum commersonii]|uniref:Uncharacterized protein n=1 Tax=Solanum commersonii TaxID=4109 RepID=A0A9J5WW56_SOLCO|nr:hypothetical protein H5410_050670 [Solanum commersonii]